MTVTPTAGIAAAWSAAKPNPSEQASQAAQDPQQAETVAPGAIEDKKAPPAPEGQGARVDIRV